MRIVISGGPKVGKTTLAEWLVKESKLTPKTTLLHTDDLIGKMEWSEASEEVSRWMDAPGPWIIEGVAAVRALRKWLERNPGKVPCDEVLWSSSPKTERTKGQEAMAKGCETIWEAVRPELVLRNVRVRYF